MSQLGRYSPLELGREIFPEMLVLPMLRLIRFASVPMLSGRGPVKLLLPRSRYWRPVWLPKEAGRVPVSWFPPAWMTWGQAWQAVLNC